MIKRPTKKVISKASVWSKAMQLSEIESTITALFWGRTGTGKTTLAGTFPKPMAVLDISERGTGSLSKDEDIDSLSITDFREFEEAIETAASQRYKTIVVDALHSLQELAIIEAKRQRKKGSGDPTTQPDYGHASGLMKTHLLYARDLKDHQMHVVFLAHDRRTGDVSDMEQGIIDPEMGPKLMPSLMGSICGMVDIVGHTYIRRKVEKRKVGERRNPSKPNYCLRIGPDPLYQTKFRSPKDVEVPTSIIDPSFEKLLQLASK